MVRTPDISQWTDLVSGGPVGPMIAGRRVLLHFMTGGCINCLHTIEELRRLPLPEDVVVVTVHTGKFDREREAVYVRALAAKKGLQSPLINDGEGRLWDAFAVRAWPTLVLVSADGYELGRVSGEGRAASLLALSEKKNLRRVENKTLNKVLCDGELLFFSRGREVICTTLTGETLAHYGNFAEAQGMARLGGELFVADRLAGEVTAISLATGARRVVTSGLRSPWGLRAYGGMLQVAEAGRHRIVSLSPSGDLMALAGLGHEGVREGDALKEALFAQPTDLDWLEGVLYVIDAEGSALRRIEGGRVETPVGWDLFTFGDRDGTGEEVRLQHPEGLCAGVGGCGNHRLFIADTYNDKIKVYDPLTDRVTTLTDEVRMPTGVAKEGCYLYIADADTTAFGRYDISAMIMERITIR